jgi:eukaryotic-like serine/threonine-protein kinase
MNAPMATQPRTAGTTEPTVGTVLDDAYRLTRLICEGAMGTVFEAVQLRLQKRVALKVMVPDLAQNPEALARFRREVEVTCQLAHPHVIQLLDYGTTGGGQPYLVMEYLHGEDLEARLQRVGRLPLAAAMDLVRQVASALAHIHAQGIVHRDLKPANVFLLPRALQGDFAKIVDFGISKVTAAETKLTRAFTMVGTPECMSPEQATGMVDQVDGRSDQWALACVVWRMLNGMRPFPATNLNQILRQIVQEEPAPWQAGPEVPRAVEQVLRRALSKKQDQRYPTIAAFYQDLEAAASPPVAQVAGGRRRPRRGVPLYVPLLAAISLAAAGAWAYGFDAADLLRLLQGLR